jgi:hypothetical protein
MFVANVLHLIFRTINQTKMEDAKQLTNKEQLSLIFDFWHRSLMHYGFWYAEIHHQMGREKAQQLLAEVFQKSKNLQLNRMAKVLGFDLEDDLPVSLLNLPKEKLDELQKAVAVNWLANDGIWFQAVEFNYGMNDAKRCNDSAWAQFSPLEASSIKNILGLSEKPGLEGLKKALAFRLYATINEQEIVEETEKSFVFRMNKCRVQDARKRKGLDDYPCKSGGLVEYTTFAEAIDSRIKTECLACPPDNHPEEWYCAWKFSLEE